MRAPAAGVSAIVLLLVAVGSAQADLRVRPYIEGLGVPLAIVQDPTDVTVQFTVEQSGLIRAARNGSIVGTFLNLQGKIAFGGERGLFSIAFPPDAATSGRFFVNFTNPEGNIVVARFHRSADPLVADPGSRFDLVWPDGNAFIPHPGQSNHNGGHMVFGPDGFLYIGTGDGGAGNDPPNNAQNPQQLLGKLLRIDVDVPDAHPKGYVVPASNPFASGVLPGTSTPVLKEIWAFGMRNPWRFNFDDPALGGSGALLIGDVGQGQWEEVDYEPPLAGGRNYGWRNREGRHANIGSPPPAYTPLTEPIHEYDHGAGGSASITGGYVYRGTALGPEFTGRYFFADFVQKRVWTIALVVDPVTGEAQAADLREHTAELGGAAVIGNVSSFGVDAGGEIYLVSYGAGKILKLAQSSVADLVVSSVTAPATGVAGKPLSIPNTARNNGDQLAAPTRVDIYMSPDSSTPGAGTLVGSRNISVGLPAGAMSAATTVVTVPPATAPGLYYVSAVVDPDNAVVEADESNNGRTAPTRVEIIRPDLVMMTVTGPTKGVVGKPITVGTTIKNTGRLAAGPFAVGIYLSSVETPGSGERIALRSVTGLGPGASLVLSTSATIRANLSPAPYFLSAVADDGLAVAELGDAEDGTNGANNSALAPNQVQVLPFLPDLEVAAIAAPPTMAVARPLTLTFTVRNTGTAPAGAFRVSFFLSPGPTLPPPRPGGIAAAPPPPGDGINVGFKQLPAGLAAGASLAGSAVVSVPGNLSENAYYVAAVADLDGEVTEITEGAAANGKVTATPVTVVRPDLRITRFEASAPPATARAARGGTLAVRNVTVRNLAAAPAATGPFTLKFYLSDDDVLDPLDVELAVAPRSPGLTPGASWAVAPTLTIPASVTTGARFLIARADALDEIFEADESNNTAVVPIEIGDFVDLQITAVTGPAAAATGRPMTASFTLRNAGTAPAGPFRVSVFMAAGVDLTPGAGTELGGKDVPALATGASLAGSVAVTIPPDFAHGPYSLSAVADALNAIPEPGGNESATFNGRVAAKPVSVVRPDLTVVSLTGPPRAARGGTVLVNTAVRNIGASPSVAPASTLKFYLSDDQVLDSSDLELAAVRLIPALTANATSAGATTLLIPASATTGAKFLLARADALDTAFESNEDNNVTMLPIEIGDFVDLSITAVSGPASVKAGAAMTLSVTARNGGTAPAGPFRITLYLAQPFPGALPGDGLAVGFKDIAGLTTGASVTTSLGVVVPAALAPGSYALTAVADADNVIPEAGGADDAAANGRVATRAISVLAP